jgi:uncharacterized protein
MSRERRRVGKMKGWLDEVEPLTLRGRIAVPYTWWVGDTGSRFLTALRDQKRILGNRCGECGTVFVPPRKNCGRCFRDVTEWVELGCEGVVTAHTIVRFASPMHQAEPPFAYVLVLLDGADAGLLHIVTGGLERLENGARVRALFSEERTGSMLDIDSFEVI